VASGSGAPAPGSEYDTSLSQYQGHGAVMPRTMNGIPSAADRARASTEGNPGGPDGGELVAPWVAALVVNRWPCWWSAKPAISRTL
jgi:hypothetical protein